MNYTFAIKPKLWMQHVEARILIDTASITNCNNPQQKHNNKPKRICYLLSIFTNQTDYAIEKFNCYKEEVICYTIKGIGSYG